MIVKINFIMSKKTKKEKNYAYFSTRPDNEEYTVERIIDKRVNPFTRSIEYLLKWKGYSDRDNTWEPEHNLDCPGLVEEFEVSRRRKHEFQYLTITSSGCETPDVSKKKVIGFDRGLKPERILACTNTNGQLLFLMQWKNSTKVDLVPSVEANMRCPEVVIDFYERHIVLNFSKEKAEGCVVGDK
ncbi:chromobox protein homolog 1-like isoform X2 [Photinus pyralis]|uniref:Chromo domain-containing protein n=1 Tax=Photinus pyralis TaxID=7054 RepID=A0A1Y1N3K9_PHOPY|nr:chromobox protein homolog 1-like isoform X2 [Photinus pyralis]